MPAKQETRTKARQFRLADETLAEMDWLGARLAVGSRADVIRQAVRRWAMAEGYRRAEPPAPPQNGNPTA